MSSDNLNKSVIHWFRHGLRVSDMPSLHESSQICRKIYPIFIFDGQSAGTGTIGFNRMRYLLDSLKDLDEQFQKYGGRLYIFKGDYRSILRELIERWSITHLSFEQDPEPIWKERDDEVKRLCQDMQVDVIERVSHTLWDPQELIATNGGQPPLNYEIFCHTIEAIGPPARPFPPPDFEALGTEFPLNTFNEEENQVPENPRVLGIEEENPHQVNQKWFGGERRAHKALEDRIRLEKETFEQGNYLPTQSKIDLTQEPRSLSPALRHGCLSVRQFYWAINDLYDSIYCENAKPRIVGQLIWREFFYTMSVNNINYGQMVNNPVCLKIPWRHDEQLLKAWETGTTGYPFIDAAMRQLIQEGWIHHAARNAVSCFLTRGDLWLSWEHGLKMFLRYLIDADWSVCAGNWMWISSSAFDTVLQSNHCISPVLYGRWLEPTGEYIRKYVPELEKIPNEFIYEPWKAPESVQQKAECIIGRDYPFPVIDHDVSFEKNRSIMNVIKNNLIECKNAHLKLIPKHVAPSHPAETRFFLCLTEDFCSNLVL